MATLRHLMFTKVGHTKGNYENEKLFGNCGEALLKNRDLLTAEKIQFFYSIYFDTLFKSFPLMKSLQNICYGTT